jgi:hypothetical protein
MMVGLFGPSQMQRADPKVISVEDLENSLEDFRSEAPEIDPLAEIPPFPAPLLTTPAPVATATAPPVQAAAPAVPAREGTVSLAELLAGDVRIESYEAVAIVQALCELVLKSGMTIGGPWTDLSDVRLSAAGTISADSAGPHDPFAAVHCLGDVLSRILPVKDFMFLRERVVEKATSSPPYYISVEELSDTLAYYERPDRAGQIRDVYNRWQTRGLLPEPPAPISRRLAGRSALADAAAFCTRYSREGAIGLIGAGILLAVIFLVFLARGPGSNGATGRTERSPAGSNLSRSLTADSSARQSAPPAPVGNSAVPGEPTKSAPVQGSTFPKRSEPPAVVNPTVSRNQQPAPLVNPLVSRKLGPPSVASPPISRAPELARGAHGKPPEVPPPSAEPEKSSPVPLETHERLAAARPEPSPPVPEIRPVPLPTAPPDDRFGDAVAGATQSIIYSARNTDVIPPAVLFSQLPGPSPLAIPQHDVPALEVLVNEQGAVDLVRAVARPRNIAESVVLTNGLSAAKAWRFRPALKDGHPVRYRLLVALTTD